MKRLAAVSAVTVAACGTTTSPSNSVEGTVGGQPLVIAEAVWTVAPTTVSPGWTGEAAFVVMSTKAGLCDRSASNTVLPGERTVTLEMIDIAGMSTTAPSAPGSYTVPIESYWAPKTGWLGTTSVDVSCRLSSPGAARAGSLTVTSIDAGVFAGSFDVNFDLNGTGQLTGTFAAQRCPGLEAAIQDTLPACQPE
jgi:hypothetical protein